MRHQTVVRARIDHETKEQAMEALQAMGLSMSDAIRLLLVRIATEKQLPFEVRVPNTVTVNAMEELDEGKGVRFDSQEEVFQDLGL